MEKFFFILDMKLFSNLKNEKSSGINNYYCIS